MTSALYLTADHVQGAASGGQVARHELAALRQVFDEVLVLDGESLRPVPYRGLDLPFLDDHFALAQLPRELTHCHIYSGTFSASVRWLHERGVTVSYTSPAHDVAVSRAEHEALGMAYPYPHLTDPQLWARFIDGLREADQVIVPSQLSKAYLVQHGVWPSRVVVLPHGYEPLGERAPYFRSEPFDASVPNAAMAPLQGSVGYLGAVGPDKGLRYLLAAWGSIPRQGRLILAGAGTETLAPFVRRFCGQNEVVLLGRVEDVDRDFYAHIGLYVQPSVSESMGIEVLEAVARGIPVIASAGGGASELVAAHPEWGAVVPARDPEAISRAIGMVSTMTRERDRLDEGAKPAERAKQGESTKSEERARACEDAIQAERPTLSESTMSREDYAWPAIERRYVALFREYVR